ncbi:MAG: hypothetical protein HQK49_22410 [Oligoflexia bacterium]|nr:hypothetical protein [Oligoflexia bacterium]
MIGYLIFFLAIALLVIHFLQKDKSILRATNIISNKKHIISFVISLIVLISWLTMMWIKYDNFLMPQSATLANMQHTALTDHYNDFNNAMMSANYVGEGRMDQIKNAIMNQSIYYKTYTQQNNSNYTSSKLEGIIGYILIFVNSNSFMVFFGQKNGHY